MPAGLLDGLSDQEVSDLYAYLRSLARAAATSRLLIYNNQA